MEKYTNIFDTPLSVFSGSKSVYPVGTRTLRQIIRATKHIPSVLEYRKKRDPEIKQGIMCFTASGTFRYRNAAGLIRHSGFICLDFDKKDNMQLSNFDELKKLLSLCPFVAFIGISVSGDSFYAMVPLAYPEKHKEHFNALRRDFAECGISLDDSCNDVCRLRFMSYDADPYINERTLIYTKTLKCKGKRYYRKGTSGKKRNKLKIERAIAEIEKQGIDITGDYGQWLKIGAAIYSEFGDNGLSYFHSISQFSDKYDVGKTDEKYLKQCSKLNAYRIGTLFYYTDLYNITKKLK